MLDEKDPELDRQVAERVITNHRSQLENAADNLPAFNYQQSDHIIEPKIQKQQERTQIYEKNLSKTTDDVTRNVVTREFLKKYISYVKSQKQPNVEEECIEYASQLYAAIR